MADDLWQALDAILSPLDLPRKAAFEGLFGKEYGSEVTGEPVSGFLLDMLLDPLNLVGGAGVAKTLGTLRSMDKATDVARSALRAARTVHGNSAIDDIGREIASKKPAIGLKTVVRPFQDAYKEGGGLMAFIDSPQMRELQPSLVVDDAGKSWLDFGSTTRPPKEFIEDYARALDLNAKRPSVRNQLMWFRYAKDPAESQAIAAWNRRKLGPKASWNDSTKNDMVDAIEHLTGIQGMPFVQDGFTLGHANPARPDYYEIATFPGLRSQSRKGPNEVYAATKATSVPIHEFLHALKYPVGGDQLAARYMDALGDEALLHGGSLYFKGGDQFAAALGKDARHAVSEATSKFIEEALAGRSTFWDSAASEWKRPLAAQAIIDAQWMPKKEQAGHLTDAFTKSLSQYGKARRIKYGDLDTLAPLLADSLIGKYTKGKPIGPFIRYIDPAKTFGWVQPDDVARVTPEVVSNATLRAAEKADRAAEALDGIESLPRPELAPLLVALGLYEAQKPIHSMAHERSRFPLWEALGV